MKRRSCPFVLEGPPVPAELLNPDRKNIFNNWVYERNRRQLPESWGHDHSREPWTDREKEILINLVYALPGYWAEIAAGFSRTVFAIKKKFYECMVQLTRDPFQPEKWHETDTPDIGFTTVAPLSSGSIISAHTDHGEDDDKASEIELEELNASPHFAFRVSQKHCVYSKMGNKDDLQELFDALRVHTRLPDGFLVQTAEETGIPIGTLKDWRHGFIRDPEKEMLTDGHLGRSNVLDRAIEHTIYDRIVQGIHAHEPLTGLRIRKLAKEMASDKYPDFKAGRTWFKGFLTRWHLSLRKAHLRRRTPPRDDVVAEFLQKFEMALLQYSPEYIVNMDETSWHVFQGAQTRTIAPTGADEVAVNVHFDEKTCITVIAAITLSGRRLPLWFLARGKTILCEKRYRENEVLQKYIEENKIIVTHTQSGWSTESLMKSYIDWLSGVFNSGPFHLVWDLHSSHRNPGVAEYARNHDVSLSYIPAGQTGDWQPLDVAVFGPLKARAVRRMIESTKIADYCIFDALVDLADLWYDNETQKSLNSAWNNLIDFSDKDATERQLEQMPDTNEPDRGDDPEWHA